MGTKKTDSGSVKTTETVFSVLETLHSIEGGRVTEVANEMGMAKSTIHRHLSTLESEGYVIREGDTFEISLRFLALGEYARTRKEAYRKIRPKVKQLAVETNESAQFLVAEQDKAVYLYRERGSDAVNTPNSRIGERIPLHATAAGKAILACYPREKVKTIIDDIGLSALTEKSITDEETLYDQIAEIQDRGYSLNQEENVDGIHAVGVPIKRTNGSPIGALSVSGPAHRLQGETFDQELPDLLLETANQLELNIAYP